MLVGVWDAMDAAIPRLRAERSLEDYTVAVAASPYAEKDSVQRIFDGWTSRIRAFAEGVGRAPRVGFRHLEAMLRDAWGPQMRD